MQERQQQHCTARNNAGFWGSLSQRFLKGSSDGCGGADGVEHHLRLPLPCLWQAIRTGGGGCLCGRCLTHTRAHTHIGNIAHSRLVAAQTQQEKNKQKWSNQSNRPESSYFFIFLLHLHHKFICCSSHNRLISYGFRSDLCPTRHHPTRSQKDKPHPRASPPAHGYIQHKTKNIHSDGLQIRALVLPEGYAKNTSVRLVGAQKNISQREIVKEKKQQNSLSEMILEYVQQP